MTPALAGAPPSSMHITHVGDGIATAQVGKTCIVIWRRGVTPARHAKQFAAVAAACAQFPEGMGFLCVVEPASDPPSEEMRQVTAQMMRDHQAHIVATACVIEGNGFRAGIARAILRSIELFMGDLPFSTRFFARSTEAAAWLATRTRGAANPVIEGVAALRAELTRVDGDA